VREWTKREELSGGKVVPVHAVKVCRVEIYVAALHTFLISALGSNENKVAVNRMTGFFAAFYLFIYSLVCWCPAKLVG
jgi:ABC-type Na+ efflux pump permease subunit